MSKKFIAILTILLLATLSLIYVLHISINENAPTPITKNSPINSPLSRASLSTLPNFLQTVSGVAASVDVALESNTPLDLIQLEIAYDPTLLFYVNIAPGNYFLEPVVALEKIDMKNGRISYALECPQGDICINPDESASIAATLSFTPINYGFEKETRLSFLPKTYLKRGREVIKLELIKETIIILEPAYLAPFASSSAFLN